MIHASEIYTLQTLTPNLEHQTLQTPTVQDADIPIPVDVMPATSPFEEMCFLFVGCVKCFWL